MTDDFYCYILRNPQNNMTYNGFTNKPKRRIRQHNQEIKGGAKFTKKFGNGDWEMYALVTGFPDKINALQCEWKIKYPNNKRPRPKQYSGSDGRIKGLNEVLKLDRWTNQSTLDNKDSKFTVWIHQDYSNLLTDLPDNITVISVEKIDLDNLVCNDDIMPEKLKIKVTENLIEKDN